MNTSEDKYIIKTNITSYILFVYNYEIYIHGLCFISLIYESKNKYYMIIELN